jgi:hypothetical protein
MPSADENHTARGILALGVTTLLAGHDETPQHHGVKLLTTCDTCNRPGWRHERERLGRLHPAGRAPRRADVHQQLRHDGFLRRHGLEKHGGGVSVTIGGTTNTPGGASANVQYNNGTAFAGDSAFT